jgi:UDP-GlcNAc:undecaprenyl-phosphate/decaprenyl-phosphate GlcNAc-1-phosphate transferase
MDIVILGFITSFIIVLLATPSLIKVAKLKHLVDEPSEGRKQHTSSIPTIGGIIIFAGFIFSYALWFPSENRNYFYNPDDLLGAFDQFKYMISALLILFFLGVKDDIIGTAPLYKLIGHIMVAFILVHMADMRIVSMHGIMGVDILPFWASILLSFFTYIVIVNGFNLIDGVDGLAAGVGFILCVLFAVWFKLSGDIPLTLLASSLARIFMGDSGSMLIGAVLSVLAIRMIEHDTSLLPDTLAQISTPVMAMSLLSYPLVDTLRVFLLRVVKGNSPFTADRNHIHHGLQLLGLNHKGTVLLIYGLNLLVVFSNLLLSRLDATLSFILLFVLANVLYQAPLLFVRKKR